MAYGLHWEWRAFGSVNPRFAETYLNLPLQFEPHEVTDDYLWIPGLEVNAKFRTGVEDGLKFKRIKQKEGPFEVWLEDEDELFEFPLQPDAWQTLSEMLAEVDLDLQGYPVPEPDREMTATLLEEAGCKIVTVKKQRESRLLNLEKGSVLVEWATVDAPQRVLSIGLENWSDDPEADHSDEQALKVLKEAVSVLKPEEEPLEPMNYLEAVKHWAKGEKI